MERSRSARADQPCRTFPGETSGVWEQSALPTPGSLAPTSTVVVGSVAMLVGVRRFELRASSSRTKRSARLSYTPGDADLSIAAPALSRRRRCAARRFDETVRFAIIDGGGEETDPDRVSPFARPASPRPRLALALALVAALVAVVAPQSRGGSLRAQSLGLGDENSWVRIQNVGIQPATIELAFYDLDGAELAVDGCPQDGGCAALQPGFGWSFFQQGFDGLPEGYRGSAYITLDQPFVSMLARDAFKDGLFQIGGDSLRLGGGGDTQYAPIVQNTAQYVSRMSVQNTSDELEACIQIAYYAEGALRPAAVDPPGATAGCPHGGQLVPPRGTLLRDERSLSVPAGFDGSAVVRTYDTAGGVRAASQLPSMVVDTRERSGPGLATYRAVGGDELSRVVVLPLVDRGASAGQSTFTTRFRIMNGDPGAPNVVELLFEGENAAGDRIEIEHTVNVLGSLTCDQRLPGAGGCLPPGEALPEVFFGTVRMQAIEPIAVVAQRRSSDGALADYRGFTAEEASRQVVLPVLNKNFGPWGDAKGWNSWFRVLTFDGSVAHVRVVYYSKHFPNGLISQPVTVDGQRTFRQWDNRRLPDGWVGSAIVVADRPVVVVANLESDVFDGDPVMLYNGVSLE